jgi:hypothetical protein
MGRTWPAVLLAFVAAVAAGRFARASAAPDPPDVIALVARVGERVGAYYHRVQQLVWLERSTVIPIGADWGPQDLARTVESEVRVEMDRDDDGLLVARVTREVRRINGREPRRRDATDRSGCTDPAPQSPEMLTFLLPGHRDEYRFTRIRQGRERDRAAFVIDFTSAQRTSRPELVEDEYGHDDCFDWKGPMFVAGRLWVDASTHDVLRLDRHLRGPADVRVPEPLQRKYRFLPWLTIDRDDLTVRYKEVAFSDPDETLLLPDSIEMVTVVRNGLQSTRRTHAFSNYRRFLAEGRIK